MRSIRKFNGSTLIPINSECPCFQNKTILIFKFIVEIIGSELTDPVI